MFNGYLSEVIDRIIVDLTTGPNSIAQQLYEAACSAGVENFQTVEHLKTLINVPPFDDFREGVDYKIRRVSKTERTESKSPDAEQKLRPAITKIRNSGTQNSSDKVSRYKLFLRLSLSIFIMIIGLVLVFLFPIIFSWEWLINHPKKMGLHTIISMTLVSLSSLDS